MEKLIIDCLGEQCPIPVVKTKKALQGISEPTEVEVHVDNEVSVQNLTRLASSQGLKSKATILEDKHFVVTMETEGAVAVNDDVDVDCTIDRRGDTIVVVNSATMGIGNDELGKVLIKGFIFAVSQLDELPKTMLFYNGGATITTEGSASIEDLKSMEAQGVEIKTCGTCLDYYGLKDKLLVGSITNMYDIVETMAKAARIIKP